MQQDSNSAIGAKKIQAEIEQAADKLKLLDTQYEQSRLIGKLSSKRLEFNNNSGANKTKSF